MPAAGIWQARDLTTETGGRHSPVGTRVILEKTIIMSHRITRSTILSIILASSVIASACTSSSSTQPSAAPAPATPTPTPTPVAKPTLAAPTAAAPPGGSTVGSRPALTVVNAVRTGTITGAVSYTFEVAANSGFNTLAASGSSPEGSGQTTFTLTSDLTGGQTYFWRAVAVADALISPASDTQTMTIVNLTSAGKIAAQQGVVLWPGTQPTGTPGRARLGVGWGIGNQTSFDGVTFLSPPSDVLRVFDLIDRGFDPDAAIRWLRANGYGSDGVYYSSVQAIGFPYQYMALIGGEWELVRRVGA